MTKPYDYDDDTDDDHDHKNDSYTAAEVLACPHSVTRATKGPAGFHCLAHTYDDRPRQHRRCWGPQGQLYRKEVRRPALRTILLVQDVRWAEARHLIPLLQNN